MNNGFGNEFLVVRSTWALNRVFWPRADGMVTHISR